MYDHLSSVTKMNSARHGRKRGGSRGGDLDLAITYNFFIFVISSRGSGGGIVRLDHLGNCVRLRPQLPRSNVFSRSRRVGVF